MIVTCRKYVFLLLFIGISLNGFTQTGPGGVGTNDGTSSLKLWYRTDFGIGTTGTSIDSWQNAAGVTAHDLIASGTARPTLIAAAQNGYDEVSFDGSDYLEITGSLTTSNFVNDQASSFIVTKRNAITASRPYATYPYTSNRFSNHITWTNGNVYFDIGTCCGSSARIQVNSLTNLNTYSYWSYDALNSTGKQLYRNGSLLQSRAGSSTYTSHATQSFRVGSVFNGTITEVIIYNQKINSAQRIIIENYLSAKYNITAAANDIYVQDDPANGDYDHDVAGIGRVDASNIHNDAQGTGTVRILNPTGLGNDEFLLWGHDNGVGEATEVVDVPAPVQARFQRVWRVSEVNSSGTAVNVGNVDIRFDLSGLGSVTASDLRLLVDTNNDGLFADETPISGASNISGNVYGFTGVSAIANNLRFTLGTINSSQTPLPIELMSFEAKVSDKIVQLSWRTATESNNAYFTVERSGNGTDWQSVTKIEGAGDSNELKEYQTVDYAPISGVSYYRLKQTDFDGSFSYSRIVSVQRSLEAISIYPNPTEDQITVIGTDSELSTFKVYDANGKNVTNMVKTLITGATSLVIDLSNLKSGYYILETASQTHKIYKK